MNDYVTSVVQRYGRAAFFIDTNILLLLIVGLYDRRLISRFKRTLRFTAEDYDLAARFVRLFSRVITTPSVLTEVSNLAGQLDERLRVHCFEVFARYIELLDERNIESSAVARLPEFTRFGLTDAAILQISAGSMIVLTDDFRLSGYMESRGLPVLNFMHLRAPNLFQ